MKRLLVIIVIFSVFLVSCEYISSRFRDYYDIRTVYITNEENYNINNLVNIFQEINESPNAEYEHIGRKTYQKYSIPYTLQIRFTFNENNDIKDIIFNSCNIIIENNSIDLFSLEKTNVSLNRYYYETNSSIMNSRNDDEINLFQKEKKLIINESDKVFIKNYYINFHNLPIDTSIQYLTIEYSVKIILMNGNVIEIENKTCYTQEIKEKHLYSPIWNRNRE
jgi:DNA replicative helicase MCM subunit Mcm2 (Cdc46/Mcm family)